uniref:Uncharacterized protein n=1 Tax=Romanomermis culicivorax TaxID=13658 RepID=A0A915J1A1_ROMCU
MTKAQFRSEKMLRFLWLTFADSIGLPLTVVYFLDFNGNSADFYPNSEIRMKQDSQEKKH